MSTDDRACLGITTDGSVTVIAFKAASMSNVEEIAAVSKQIKEFIEENQPNKIVVDFEQVKFFSSQLLGVLLGIWAKLKTYDGEVVISSINPQLYRVFKITRLDKIFKFFPDRQTAVSTISAN